MAKEKTQAGKVQRASEALRDEKRRRDGQGSRMNEEEVAFDSRFIGKLCNKNNPISATQLHVSPTPTPPMSFWWCYVGGELRCSATPLAAR